MTAENSPPPPSTHPAARPPRPTVPGVVLNAVRGGLVGLAELVPGVSGGTVALVLGIYERVLLSANRLVDGLRLGVPALLRRSGDDPAATGPGGARARLRSVDWWLVVPMVVGMAVMVVTMAGVMESFVSDHTFAARSLFLGMVAASVAVPLLMVDRDDLRSRAPVAVPLALVAAVATFVATGFSAADKPDPNPVLVFVAAAVAVCALVLPGVSGSFLLYALGLYGTTLGAVHARDLGYIAVFGLGAVTGLVLFVRLMERLLTHARTLTLVTMAGLMLGSLRALWPWQSDDATLHAPGDGVPTAVGLVVLGAAVVTVTVVAERRYSRRRAA
ncbi:DUF368 domain-containing protein [Corynebacterium bovis]|uniref:DUF368 domain-containing protein n=1 Tax=Corynebacterium bovis TaxID=36808 RepID=A0A3R8QIN2_9CORY|nr:DUF368 domain-containing protein [Corynebacterium bovis]RRO92858.1 DUF368 domain-containing protein [Corynebacterium bovis]RRO97531.1 DUF368 domain-containing protein [Corynebacterium bovis]RRO99367.1 DUF368 domain-containing protein [Corynebacterium bovis]RRQ01004.1 DUF368 domain-containing protein [Corynebacterium bovis]RRQ04783.1 DUF368 domain-containing protein [Corynebacterium bovis]